MTCKGYANACVCERCRRRERSRNTRGIARKEVRQFIESHLTPHGWVRVEDSSGGHLRFWHPDQDTDRLLVLARMPGDHRWRLNALRDARHIWPGQPTAGATRAPKASSKPDAERAVVRVHRLTRQDMLREHARGLGVALTPAQADDVLDRTGKLSRARSFLDRVVEAKRRADTRREDLAA